MWTRMTIYCVVIYMCVYFAYGVYMATKVVRVWHSYLWVPALASLGGGLVGLASCVVFALMIAAIYSAGNFGMTEVDAGIWATGQSLWFLWGSLGRHLPHK